MKAILATVLCLGLVTGAKAADIDLTKGRLASSGSYGVQTVEVTNNTGRPIEYLKVECGFFRGGQLLASGFGNTENVLPGQKAYFDVGSDGAAAADSTDCRISVAH